MTSDSRVTYRRRHCYATRSNKTRKIKTPGGSYRVQYRTKRVNNPKCGDCKKPLGGMKAIRPIDLKHAKRHQKTVSRAYGGSRCAACVRDRIKRAFLIEEQKIVKSVLRAKSAEAKKGKK